MSGFELTNEDIETVLSNYGVVLTAVQLSEVFGLVDAVETSNAALAVDFEEGEDDETILNRQTEAAYDEIAAQLVSLKVLSVADIEAGGNTNLLGYLRIKGIIPQVPKL